MTKTTQYILTAAAIVILILAVFVVKSNSQRSGTEQLTAEQVVDAEVEAAAQFEAAGGKY